MRAFLALVAAVFVAIGIGVGVVAAVGTSLTDNATQFAETAINSIATQPFEQTTTSVNVAGLNKSDQIINEFSIGLELSSDDGSTSLDTAKLQHVGIDLNVVQGTKVLIELRLIDASAVYMKADLASIAALPGLPKSAKSQIDDAAPLLGGRWFQLPANVIAPIKKELNQAQNQENALGSTTAQKQKLEQQFITAARNHGSASIVPVANGQDDVHAKVMVLPFFKDLLQHADSSTSQLPRQLPSKLGLGLGSLSKLSGTATFDLYADAASADLHRVVVGYANGKSSGNVTTVVSHVPTSIKAPAGAIALPQVIINALRKEFSSAKLPALA